MKPTEYSPVNLEGTAHPGVLLEHMEEEGYELIKLVEGMCYIDGKWQTIKQAKVEYRHDTPHGTIAYADGNDVASETLYRLAPSQEEL